MAETSKTLQLRAAGDSHIGGRDHNEDVVLIRPDLGLFAVADGAGGHNAGNVAAALATTTVARAIEVAQASASPGPRVDRLGLSVNARRLSAAVHVANLEIMEIAKRSERHHGMGTTITAAYFVAGSRSLHVASVGDSRCYRLRAGLLELLTDDHTLANHILEVRPEVPDSATRDLPPNVVTRALGMSDALRVSVRSHIVLPGDRYLLCTDGLSDVVHHWQLARMLSGDEGPEGLVANLIQAGLESESRDNIAAVVVLCGDEGVAVTGTSKPISSTAAGPPSGQEAAAAWSRRDGSADEPEIMVTGLDSDNLAEVRPEIHVVPADTLTEGSRSALAKVLETGAARRPAGDEASVCGECGERILAQAKWCPFCGARLEP